MKIHKVNGTYQKPGIRAHTRLPLSIWLPLLLVCAGVILAILLQTAVITDGLTPEFSSTRKKSVKLVAVGDIACSPDDKNFNDGDGVVGACKQKDVGYAIENENADAVLFLGDIQYPTGDFIDYERSFIPYFRDIKTPIYSVAGNHDYGNGQREPGLEDYSRAFDLYFTRPMYEIDGATYFDFSLASWKVYALDSNCEYVGGCDTVSRQFSWLNMQVKTPSMCSIGAWHHPVKTSGQHRGKEDTARAADFEQLLVTSGTDIILNGHDHHYERIKTGDTRQFIVGTGGMSLRKTLAPYAEGSEKIVDDSFGYLYLELFPGRYEWAFKNTTGDVLDSGSANCL